MSIRNGLSMWRSAATTLVAAVTLLATISCGAVWPARAQTLPVPAHKAFVLIEYQIKDRPLFQKLRDAVRESLKAYNGDLVMREKVAPIFGANPTNVSVIGFDSVETARKWLGSKDMAALAAQRDKAAEVSTYLVEKLD